MGTLDGKVAVVTGAASEGIGRGIARMLARAGADVAIGDFNPRINDAASELAADTGRRILPSFVDVRDAAHVKNFMTDAVAAFMT